MAILLLLVFSLPLLGAAEVTTVNPPVPSLGVPSNLDDIFLQNVNVDVNDFTVNTLELYILKQRLSIDYFFPVAFTEELFEYPRAVEYRILTEFARVLAAVPAQSIYDDLNRRCSEYQEMPIVDLATKPGNTSCAQIQLGEMLTSKFKMAVEFGLRQVSRDCIGKKLSFCSVANRSCTLAYEERMGQILIGYIEDINYVDVKLSKTFLDIVLELLVRDLLGLFTVYSEVGAVYEYAVFLNTSTLTIKPFEVENILRPLTIHAFTEANLKDVNSTTVSEDELLWGIIKSNRGKLDLPCSNYRKLFSRNSEQFSGLSESCFSLNTFQSKADLMRCAYSDPKSPPVTWSTFPSVYFHSQCLCLAYKGKECGVKAPQGVDPRFYCLSVLLRDFQRQISYRPAVTYLDYAFQTRVPVCKFVTLIEVSFRRECLDPSQIRSSDNVPSVQCYFKGLVNKHLNCSETVVVNTFNYTVLCDLKGFMQVVVCDEEADKDVLVPYYGAGDSTLVLVLTYLEVAVRVLTLVTYVACPELRNLPGKLLIAYQTTALLRLLVVRASLEDMPLAVHIDVAMDLSSTLWLFSYLHFLTESIKALRPPDSLSRDEARMVLLRYALLGWTLPAALSAVFFWIDETLDSRVQVGQLLFLMCNYVVLFGNIYMFFKNTHFYYGVRSKASNLQKGGKARSVFADLFNFAVKTSVLSGAGITFRLVFTQIQGLEHLLGYYHALGTLQGLLLFFLFGCNREARVFWYSLFRSTLHFKRPQNT